MAGVTDSRIYSATYSSVSISCCLILGGFFFLFSKHDIVTLKKIATCI